MVSSPNYFRHGRARICLERIRFALPASLSSAQASAQAFFAAVVFANLAVAAGILRRSPAVGHEGVTGVTGVPLIHEDEVAPLRHSLKKRFPPKKDPPSPSLGGDVGEDACGIPSAR